MYLVYLDESTAEDGDYFVVGGLAVYDRLRYRMHVRGCLLHPFHEERRHAPPVPDNAGYWCRQIIETVRVHVC